MLATSTTYKALALDARFQCGISHDNLGCPKCKRNSAEFLEKKLPSNKEDMLRSFNNNRVVQSDCYILDMNSNFLRWDTSRCLFIITKRKVKRD